MEQIYNSLHLVGYKINELSNGDFTALRPDNKQVLFNREGEVIITEFKDITQISDELYGIEKGTNILLVNNKGEILATTNGSYNWEDLCDRDSQKHYVRLYHTADEDTLADIYSLDGKVCFKNVPIDAHQLINHNGTAKLVYSRRKLTGTEVIFIDTKGNKEVLNIGEHNVIDANNKYINTRAAYKEDKVFDFNGKVVYAGSSTIIDTTNLDSDTVLILDESEHNLTIFSKSCNLVNMYKFEKKPTHLQFNTYKDILYIKENDKGYFLNIKTLERTFETVDINSYHGDVVITPVEKSAWAAYKVDLDTFDIKHIVLGENGYCRESSVVVYNGQEAKHYNFDLKPILHEYDIEQ